MNFYAILNLPSPTNTTSSPPSPQTLKGAYRRALLTHHPDKSQSRSTSTPNPSVDDIVLAYQTLASPLRRAAHDRDLVLGKPAGKPRDGGAEAHHRTGLETLDLDDLEHDVGGTGWFRGCRCGQERGYELAEAELESAADGGMEEVLVGCRGCSLWIRVAFGTVEDEGEGGEQEVDMAGVGSKGVEKG